MPPPVPPAAPVPPAPPASPPPASVDDCRRITEAVRVAWPPAAPDRPPMSIDAAMAYNLRGWYQAVLDYSTTARDPAPLYDFWWAVEGHKRILGRGFYLDLWDLYDHAGAGAGAFSDADRDLLRFYICQINDEFVSLLSPTSKIGHAPAWQQRIADLAAGSADDVGTRRFLYSVLNLYADLYSDTVAKEGRDEFKRQLAAADAAKACLESADAPLLRPQAALAARSGTPGRAAVVHVLAFAYKSLAHFGTVPLPELAARLADRLGVSGAHESLLRLLKFWAADCPLVRHVLRDKCGYEFHAPVPPRPVELPAYHGTDNFVCLVGGRGVGKTGFMFASEAASKLPPAPGAGVPELAVRHDAREETRVQEDREKWLAGQPSDTRNQSLYAQTAVSGLCRFTFYDIPGEELYHPDRNGPSPWLEDHFEKRKPCALLMMFEPGTTAEEVGRYVRLVELLEKHLGVRDARYRDLPVYFVLNKADLILPGDGPSRRELKRVLQGGDELRPGFRFPSARFEDRLRTAADVADRFANTPACCRNLALLDVLTGDLTRLAPVVNACLQFGYTNLSFVYTTCLAGKDPGYGAVRALWADLTRFLGESTIEARKEFYRTEFTARVETHFGFADGLVREATITQDKLALTNEDLTALVDQASKTQGVTDFDTLSLKRARQPDLDLDRDLPRESGYRAIKSLLDKYTTNKEALEQELNRAIPALLRELGVPDTDTVTDIMPHRYQQPTDDHLRPGPSGSTAVQGFLAGDGYKTARREFEQLLASAIDRYNADRVPDEQVFVAGGKSGAVNALGVLDGALWNVDAVGRQEVLFNPRYGSLNTLCAFKDRATTTAEEEAMNAWGGGEQLGRVLRSHNKEDRWRTLIRLFKNFFPRYPQFAYATRYDLDRFKAEVLNQLRAKRMKLDEDVEGLVVCLLGVWHQVRQANQNPEDICKQFQAKYLFQMLQRNGFKVDEFLKGSVQFRAELANARTALEQAQAALGVFRTNKTQLAAQLTAFHTAVAKVDINQHTLTRENLNTTGRSIVRRLEVAEAVLAHASKLVGTKWATLGEMQAHAIPNFALPQLVIYNRNLDDYVRARKFLILQERAQYLVAAAWLHQLEPSTQQFYQAALNPATFLGSTRPNAGPGEIAAEFKAGIEALRAKAELWHNADRRD